MPTKTESPPVKNRDAKELEFQGLNGKKVSIVFDEPELTSDAGLLATELKLAMGRPRMAASAVYLFLMIRGFLGSLTSNPARRFLRESMSLYGFLQSRGLSMPGATTILENVNLVSYATRELILDRQIAFILREG